MPVELIEAADSIGPRGSLRGWANLTIRCLNRMRYLGKETINEPLLRNIMPSIFPGGSP